MESSVIGFPRMGRNRELKYELEKYFRKEITQEEVKKTAERLREEHWRLQKEQGIQWITSNDFSLYDTVLDTIVLFGAIPEQYKQLNLNEMDTYFAMARGYQGKKGDVKALAMKKWFNTNYHYLVPEFDDELVFSIHPDKIIQEYKQAKKLGIETKPVILGAFTFLKLALEHGKKRMKDRVKEISGLYYQLFEQLGEVGVQWIQIDEPCLVMDLSKEEVRLFQQLYTDILQGNRKVQIILQTYFGDIRDCYKEVMELPFQGIGLDFIEGEKTVTLIEEYGFPVDKFLFAGIISGKNIWRCNYQEKITLIHQIQRMTEKLVIQPSCSLLHVPFTVESEQNIGNEIKRYFSFAKEKLRELQELCILSTTKEYKSFSEYRQNEILWKAKRSYEEEQVQKRICQLSKEDFERDTKRKDRFVLQRDTLSLPLFPTTTIGSFPQTKDVKANRRLYKNGEITQKEYCNTIKKKIKECIELQENIGLDVLVHGEYERNDMVEFFGENLHGFVFTDFGWVQSYGTRCVKPPIIFGDVKREKAITVDDIVYAQSLTTKPVKGMLTGPVTILNWSFPREDKSLKEMAYQIGIAIQEEVIELEKAGIKIIQIDEAALKEKLPIRKIDWYSKYLDWAIPAFRLCHSKVKPTTQIHTHMCYSEFEEIVKDIDAMDADVISFEASRSKLAILPSLKENAFETEVGPGVYDIHSPRIPSVKEIEDALENICREIPENKVWVNPDCGLKTRGMTETVESLKNMVEATKHIRNARKQQV